MQIETLLNNHELREQTKMTSKIQVLSPLVNNPDVKFNELIEASLEAIESEMKEIRNYIEINLSPPPSLLAVSNELERAMVADRRRSSRDEEEEEEYRKRKRKQFWFKRNFFGLNSKRIDFDEAYIDPTISTTLISSRWSSIEHGLFIVGLYVFGRNASEQIVQLFLPSLTVDQITCHTQKYFQRQERTGKNGCGLNGVNITRTRGRQSIHDGSYFWHENGMIEKYFINPNALNPGQLSLAPMHTSMRLFFKRTLPLYVSIVSLQNEEHLRTERALMTAKLYNKHFR